MARAVLVLVAGLAVGLAAGWALFADRPSYRGAAQGARDAGQSPGSVAAGGATETPGDAPGTEGGESTGRTILRPAGTTPSEEQWIRGTVRDSYREAVKEHRDPPEDLFEAAVGEAVRETARQRESNATRLGQSLAWRERVRAEAGEISGSPLVLQVSGRGNVVLTRRGTDAEPLDVSGPPPGGSERASERTYVTAGLVPPGRTFLIERAVVRACFGADYGRLRVSLPDMEDLQWDRRERGIDKVDTELKGLVRLRHGRESEVRLNGTMVAASVELHGRLVPAAEGEETPPRPLVMGDGWLTGEPVLIQVLADHGGGNDRTVYLSGKLYRIDSLEPETIWTETPRLRDRRDSLAHYRGCGRVPAGKAYRITRVEYRARLDPEKSTHSGLVIRIAGKEVVKTNASEGAVVNDAWNGDVLILPGGEEGVSITCSMYGLAEMVIHGDIVDQSGERK
ncbi:MAG: hypothetical protein L6Q95_14485 [Planctomycetes bacterium]|nr:hypothetical protein [Planctomycetota bacterium]